MADGGTSLSDDVAITALVVALFALVVGLSQFLQAILGTAEGYRRCASSVIGPWSKLRNRVFRWSEFRFETKYVVPKIMLVSELGYLQKDDCYLLQDCCTTGVSPIAPGARGLVNLLQQVKHSIFPQVTVGEVLRLSLHLKDDKRDSEPDVKGLSQDLESLRAGALEILSEWQSEMMPHSQMGAAWKSLRQPKALDVDAYLQQMLIKKQTEPGHISRNALPVTWVSLLRHLHLLYLEYSYKACSAQNSDAGNKPALAKQDAILSGSSEKLTEWMQELSAQYLQVPYNHAYTKAAIVPVQETWDFMPADVSRPLASSTVATVIVLLLRLGLQWRSLDRARSQMSADGNGASVSSTDVRGLGIVLKFSRSGRILRSSTLVPNRAADKLMCGIIPGDIDLVRRDFDMIDNDRKVIPHWRPGAIYDQLGLDEKWSELLHKQSRWTTHNEVVSLLSCFVPLCYIGGCDFYFPGWEGRQYSVFHFFETRLALLVKMKSAKFESEALVAMRLSFTALLEDYRYEFFDRYTVVKPHAETLERSISLARKCKEIFSATDTYFKAQGYAKTNGTDKTWYMQLVAAHARLSWYVNDQLGVKKAEPQEKIMQQQQPLMDEYGIESEYFAEHLYDQVKRYIAAVEDPKYGIVQYMRDRAFKASDKGIVEAWWALMIRGVVWDLSCKCLPYPGEPVPSSYYHDETSVWIT